MQTNYNQTSLLDIVFENRNKAYGAYVLRSEHDRALRQAMLLSFSAIFILIAFNFIAGHLKGAAGQHALTDEIISVKEVTLPQKLPPVEVAKPAQISAPKAKSTISNTTMHVVANSEPAKDSIPNVDELLKNESGIANNASAVNDGLGMEGGNGNGLSAEVKAEPAPINNEPLRIAEVMPEFPGGEGKLLKFLADNTEYPAMERDAGLGGKVLAEVVINLDGHISDIHIIKSPSAGFSREVTRVAKLIPPFKPGMQQGRPVRVKMVIPFSFSLAGN